MFSFFKKKEKAVESKVTELRAYISGKVIPIENVGDGVFSAKILGDGLAIEPIENIIIAPSDGIITTVMMDSKHAVGMILNNGAEILIHEGLDTVDMNGQGFELYVKEGQKVKEGDRLISFTPEYIKKCGHPLTCILVITNGDDFPNTKFQTGMDAVQGETIIVRF